VRILGFLVVAAFVTSQVFGASAELDQARKLYDSTDFDRSLKLAQGIQDKDGAVYEMIGMDNFMLGQYKKATDALEKAIALDPKNSDYALWIGRAYGRRAETSSFLTASGNASKARQYFEKAVALDPRNLDALEDLFEYCLQAPGFLGGGLDRADAVARQMAGLNPAEGQWAQARMAEQRRQFGGAEAHFRRAAEMTPPHQIGRRIDLARFLARQGKFQESDQELERAHQVAPDSPKLMYAEADIYIQHGRRLDEARTLLRRYLSCALTPDDPPRAQAQKLLTRVAGA
jgi:tetratricopeptide (TPR) repeat protein